MVYEGGTLVRAFDAIRWSWGRPLESVKETSTSRPAAVRSGYLLQRFRGGGGCRR
jgi:hypothetical protein